jgi:frataxin
MFGYPVQKRLWHGVCRNSTIKGFVARRRGLHPPQVVAALGVNNRVMQKRWFESEADYHRIADDTLEGLQDQIEQALEVLPQAPAEMDISYASGVLTISLPPHGTWVLNKQTPNQVRLVFLPTWKKMYIEKTFLVLLTIFKFIYSSCHNKHTANLVVFSSQWTHAL